MTREKVSELAAGSGFSNWGYFDPGELRLKKEVRAMCASDRCRHYGKSWSCPPYCGTLEELDARLGTFGQGIVLQTTGEIEDSFDYEGMMEAERLHKEKMEAIHSLTSDESCLALSSGPCMLCGSCTCPDRPCRMPDKMMYSMEAYGLIVSEVCDLAGVPYRYGENTVTFTGCLLY